MLVPWSELVVREEHCSMTVLRLKVFLVQVYSVYFYLYVSQLRCTSIEFNLTYLGRKCSILINWQLTDK